MKFLIVTLAIAMMVQVALASRKLTAEEEREKYLTLAKEAITGYEHSVKETLKEMPNTEEYSKYRHLLEELETDFEEYHKTSGNCFTKTKAIANKYKGLPLQFIRFGMLDKYSEVKGLLEKHRGDLDDTIFTLRYGLAKPNSERIQHLSNLEC